jgi:AraC-like DNA-binding protein
MHLHLSTDDLVELLAPAGTAGLPVTASAAWPSRLGQGTFTSLEVRRGVVLYVIDLAPSLPIRITSSPGLGYYEWGYYVRGRSEGRIGGSQAILQGRPGWSEGLYVPAAHGGEVRFAPGSRVVTVAIAVTPPALADLLGTPESSRAERWLAHHAQQRSLVETPRPLGPATTHVLGQMLNCSFSGATRLLFLEGAVLQLLACEAAEGTTDRRLGMPPDDQQLIRHAAAQLELHLDAPPTLHGLARLVGTNELKLKRGFRAVFGTTVFGYLRQRRLEQARQLLLEHRVSVVEAATRVGYACPSRFAAAFRRQFKTSPSSLRRGH